MMILKTLRLSAVLLMALSLSVGCDKKADSAAKGGDKAATTDKSAKAEPAKPEAPPEMSEKLDVGAAVKDKDDTRYAGLTMTGPKGSVVEDSGMGLTVKWGKVSFEFRFVFEDETPVAKGKKEFQTDELDQLVKLHVDTPNAVLAESKSKLGGANNHSFVATVKVGDKSLVCRNKGYGSFTKVQAEALLKTCQSMAKATK